MILRSLRFASIGAPFRDREVSLDFTGLPPGVYALVGTNGGGKSTTLELMGPGTLYRRFISYRESFLQKAVSRQAFAELTFEIGGEIHKVVVQADAKAGKTEAYWYEQHRTRWEPKAGPRLADVDAYRDRFFPSLELLQAGPFCAQKVTRGNGSFFAADPADRKALFVEALGLGRLQELSEEYGKQAAEKARELVRLDGELAGIGEPGVLITSYTEQKTKLAEETVGLEKIVTEHVTRRDRRAEALAHAKQEHARVAQEQESYARARDAWLTEGAAIDKEARALEAERARLTAAREARDAAPTGGAIAQAIEEVAWAREAVKEREERLRSDRVIAQEQQAAFNDLRQKRDSLSMRLRTLEPLAGALAGVDLSLDLCRKCPLTQQAQPAVAEVATLPGALADAQAAVEASEGVVAGILADVRKAETDLRDAVAEARELETTLAALEKARAAIPADLDQQWAAYEERAAAQADRIARRAVPVKVPLEDVSPLEPLEKALSDADASFGHARQRHQDALGRLQDVETRLALAWEQQTRRESILAQRAAVALDSAALQLLSTGLGPKGLQALYIDQAGPAVEELTNRLLHETFGPRFSIGFDTRRLKKGKKATDPDAYSEVFDLRILDAWASEERAQGSGGETTWFDTAFRLALSIYVTETSGKELRTLWFDEPSGGLSADFAPLFTEMLKAARALGGFHHVFLVSHQREVWGACDGFFVFKDGSVNYVADVESVDEVLNADPGS